MLTWGVALALTGLLQEERVNITIAGATVRSAVEQIADVTDTKLEVADGANYNTLVLRLDNAPLEEALEKIAQVTSAEWHDVGDKRVLRVSGKTTTRQESEDRQHRREWITKALADLRERLRTEDPPRDYTMLALRYAESVRKLDQSLEFRKQSHALLRKAPGHELARHVMLTYSADQLMGVEPGTQQTYSDRRTLVLKQYPSEAARVFAMYRQPITDWREAVSASYQKFPRLPNSDRRGAITRGRGTPATMATNLIASDTSITLHCWLFNEFGESILGGDHSLSGAPYEAPANLHLEGKTTIPMPAVYASYMFINYRPPGMGDAEVVLWRSRFRQQALNLTENDPIAVAVGPMLVDMAGQNDRQLVALVPDEAWQWTRGARINQREYTPSPFASLVAHDWAMAAIDEDGWVLASPSRPASARRNYMDRKPLQKLARAVDEHGYVRILDVVDYVSRQPSDNPFSFETTVIGHVVRSSGMLRPTQLIESGRIELMRILAAAGPILRVGSDLHVEPRSDLGRQIAHWIFRSRAGFFTWSYAGESDPQSPVNSYHYHRSLALPGGVPPGTVMRLTVEDEKATFFRRSPGTGKLKPEGAHDRYVGSYVSQWEKRAEFNAVQFTTVSKLTVEITFPGGYKLTKTLTEVPPPSDDAWRTMAQLTKAERADLERLKNEHLDRIGR